MKKIPTVFERDWEGDKALVTRKILVSIPAGAVATRKRDGMACMVRGGSLFKRHDVKAGKVPPAGFEPCEVNPDAETGHWPGWIAVRDAPENKHLLSVSAPSADGTYEFCGPKVQGNPEGLSEHRFFAHGGEVLGVVPVDFDGLKSYLAEHAVEGIVWWQANKPLAKIKRRNFGLSWPIR